MSEFAILLNRVALGSITALCVCSYLIHRHLQESLRQNTAKVFYITVLIISALAYLLLWRFGTEEPLTTMLRFMFIEGTWARPAVCIYYLACTCATVAVFTVQLENSQPEPNIRKFFHLVVCLVCVSGLVADADHLLVASVMITGLFVLTECTRALRVEPFGIHLHRLFVHFIDAQDSPQLIVTPIYLICGIFLPLWLHPITDRSQLTLRHFSGVISVGVGDSMAAFFGRRYGSHKWPSSKKSVEGTVAAIVSQTLTFGLLITCLHLEPSAPIYWMFISSVVVSLAEIYCTSMDNIVLPVIMYLMLSLKF